MIDLKIVVIQDTVTNCWGKSFPIISQVFTCTKEELPRFEEQYKDFYSFKSFDWNGHTATIDNAVEDDESSDDESSDDESSDVEDTIDDACGLTEVDDDMCGDCELKTECEVYCKFIQGIHNG